MYFQHDLGPLTWGLIAVFIVAYGLYLLRVRRLGRRLHSASRGIFVKLFLRVPAFGALVLACLGPAIPQAQTGQILTHKNILMAVDVSHSMDADDVQPSRLQRARFELSQLTQALPQDRFGIIMFTSGAYLQCPLTTDRNVLGIFLQALSSNLLTQQGTALRPVVDLALEKFSQLPPEAARVLLIATDGEDFGPPAADLFRSLQRQGVSLVLLGVGTTQGAVISFPEKKDLPPVLTRLDRTRLMALAETFNAPYFEITAAKNEFPALTTYLGGLRGTEAGAAAGAAPVYAYFLGVALVLLAFDVLLTVRVIEL